jgi:hypothetical protein
MSLFNLTFQFLRLICGSQFTSGGKKSPVVGKPACTPSGRPMNLHKPEGDIIPFGCYGYPACVTFRKFILKEVV